MSVSGSILHERFHGAQIDEILAKTTSGQTPIYYSQDGLGSTVALTDSTGKLVEHYIYDVYGKVTIYPATGLSPLPSSFSAYGNRFLFTGREYLSELNLYDYRNRKYSADLGRWLERDPLTDAELSQGPNLYEYVGNDPVAVEDSSGLFAIPTGVRLKQPPTPLPCFGKCCSKSNCKLCCGAGGIAAARLCNRIPYGPAKEACIIAAALAALACANTFDDCPNP